MASIVSATARVPCGRACAARVTGLGGTGFLVPSPLRIGASKRKPAGLTKKTGELHVVRAQDQEFDFDALLAKAADKFEKAENKPVVIGYGVGALVAFFIVEWLIHLPVLDILLGFPAQLLGVLAGPYLLIRYLVDKEDITKDVEMVVGKVVGLLPGSNEV